MALFAISYDLHKQRTYQPVWDQLESWGAVRLLESLWLVELNATAQEARKVVQAVADNDDSIAVIELKTSCNWSIVRGRDEGVAWLRKHIP